MEQDKLDRTDQGSGSEFGSSAPEEKSLSVAQPPLDAGKRPRTPWPEPTVLTLRDLADLPGQILPEETYRHLKNAGREALLALVSLVGAISRSTGSTRSGKVRRQIDVE